MIDIWSIFLYNSSFLGNMGVKMNILHLKYAVEVEKTASITKAAENLFMGQPNLSRSIKELEEAVEIKIFRRTAKGILPTEQGAEFLKEAKSILLKIENLETAYKREENKKVCLDVSAPKSSYITNAFAKTIVGLPKNKEYDINYRETGALAAIDNLVQGDYKLAVIRVKTNYLESFTAYMNNKKLDYEEIVRLKAHILTSEQFSIKNSYTKEEVENFTEIIFGDIYMPPNLASSKIEHKRKIQVYDRACAYDFLNSIPNTYMYITDFSQDMLKFMGLKEISIKDVENIEFADIVVWEKKHTLNFEEKVFIENLKMKRHKK